MDNPEKLATCGTQDEGKQNKNTTQYVIIIKTNVLLPQEQVTSADCGYRFQIFCIS